MNQTANPLTSFSLQSINPATGSVIEKHKELSENELKNILHQLEKTSAQWATTPLTERLKLIASIKASLEKSVKTVAETITLETGKPISQSHDEVIKCIQVCDYYLEVSEELLQPTIVETSFSRSYYLLKPLGTILLIMPWNYPVWQVFRALIPALALGNNVALKHAGNVQFCAQLIERILIDAGAPTGLFTNLAVTERLTKELIQHGPIKGISLTGSINAGREIAQQAGKRLIKSVMELGGNNPQIVFKDADIYLAAQTAAAARLVNCGQVCTAPKLLIVDRTIEKEFTHLLTQELPKYKPSDPSHCDSVLGPMARKDLLNLFHEQLNQTRAQGANCVYGGNRIDSDGFWHEPTLLTDVPRNSIAANTELFGPALTIYTVRDEADAIEFANQSSYGLGASLFTADEEKAEKLAVNSINTGSVFINSPVKSNVKLPFGGVDESGYGRELGPYGLSEFANVKTIAIH